MKLGNLIIAGIVTGSIYATFAVCVAVWYRVSNILNLAVGDFAMVGALCVDNLYRVRGMPLWAAIATTLLIVAVFGWLYDIIVLRLAVDGRGRAEGIVLTFFFTFALSFFIDGVAKMAFGSDVHAAPALWNGASIAVADLHVARAGILVLACAVLIGGAVLGLHPVHAGRQGAGGLRRERARGADRRHRHPALPAVDLRRDGGHRGGVRHRRVADHWLHVPVGRDDLADRVPRRRLRRIPQTRAGAAGGLFIGVLEALLGGYVSAEYGDDGDVRDPRRAGARLAARPGLRIGGVGMSRAVVAAGSLA